MSEKKKVLFVCLGNICRSPVAEAVFRKLTQDRGVDHLFLVDSGGTIDFHIGEQPDPRMREAAGRRGYALEHRARQISRRDLETFDLIVPMDMDNLSEIQKLDPYDRFAEKIRLLCDFIPESATREVPDPYYGGRDGFDKVITLVEAGCNGILDEMLQEDACAEPELTA